MHLQQLHTAVRAPDHTDSRTRLIEAAIRLIRTEGYSATSAEGIAAAAGVSKGSLYHHFPDKEDLTLVAIEHWRREKLALFASAPYRKIADPVERLLAYVGFQQQLMQGGLPEFTCLLGTLAQTVYARYPDLRTACAAAIEEHTSFLRADVTEAFRRYGAGDERGAARFALFMQATLQGAFVLAKAQSNPAVAIECMEELKQSISATFSRYRALRPVVAAMA